MDREGEALFVIGDLNHSKAFLLTDTIILHHWFLGLLKMAKCQAFYFLFHVTKSSCYRIVNEMMLIAYIWFAAKTPKPPDKQTFTAKHIVSFIKESIEDVISTSLGFDFDIGYWCYIFQSFMVDVIFDILQVFIKVEYRYKLKVEEENAKFKEWVSSVTNKEVIVHQVNRKNHRRFKFARTILHLGLYS